jgi:hypothetical protein
MIARLRLPQPPTKGKVLEFAVAGFIGRWFQKKNWGGVTLTLPFLSIILFWVESESDLVHPEVRFHEFVHIEQRYRYSTAIQFVYAYSKENIQRGYWMNRFEIEARARARAAAEDGFPDWCATG